MHFTEEQSKRRLLLKELYLLMYRKELWVFPVWPCFCSVGGVQRLFATVGFPGFVMFLVFWSFVLYLFCFLLVRVSISGIQDQIIGESLYWGLV